MRQCAKCDCREKDLRSSVEAGFVHVNVHHATVNKRTKHCLEHVSSTAASTASPTQPFAAPGVTIKGRLRVTMDQPIRMTHDLAQSNVFASKATNDQVQTEMSNIKEEKSRSLVKPDNKSNLPIITSQQMRQNNKREYL